MKFKVGLLFCSLIPLVGAAAFAEVAWGPVTGRVYGDAYVPTQAPANQKTFNQLTGQLWLGLDPRFSEHIKGHFLFDGLVYDGKNSNLTGDTNVTNGQGGFNEAYFAYQNEGLDLRVGEQVIVWGKSDSFNPTDFHSSKDYTLLNPDEEARRSGGLGLQLVFTPNGGGSPWTTTLIITPAPAESKILIASQVIPAGVTVNSATTPALSAEYGDYGIKAAYTGKGWDASLSLFRGMSKKPELQEVAHQLGFPVTVQVNQVYRRVKALGFDTSFTSDKWVYRGEAAYVITENADGTNPLITPTHFDYVVGAERPLGDDFRLQFQFIERVIPNFTSPAQVTGPDPVSQGVNQALASANALLNQYQDGITPSSTLRLAYTNEANHLEAEIFFMYNYIGSEYLFRPKVAYAATDFLKLSLGLEDYNGPASRPLGAMSVYDSVFFEARYIF